MTVYEKIEMTLSLLEEGLQKQEKIEKAYKETCEKIVLLERKKMMH